MKRLLLLHSLLWFAIGCQPVSRQPEMDPQYRAAQQAIERQDFAAAASAYRQLLDAHPAFGRGHLELGLLYDEKLADPFGAIYHYRRARELEANPDKRRVVDDYIERARLALPGPRSADSTELFRLQAQNQALLHELATLKAQLALPVTNVAPPAATNVVVEPPKVRTHVVQKGETLYSLSVRYYGSGVGVERIYQANKAALPNRDQLRVGQSLIIP